MSDQGATAQAKDKAQEVAGQAQDTAQEAVGQARGQLRRQVDERSTQAGQRVGSQAQDLRSVGEELRRKGQDQPAKVADQAAQRLERVGSWLTESDADRILHDVERMARHNPWALVAGGMALGFAASRALKASSSDRYHGRPSDGHRQLPVPADEQRFVRSGAAPTPEGLGGPGAGSI